MTGVSKTNVGNSWLAWTCDAIDFFNVALSVTNLQEQFHQASPSSIVRRDLTFLLAASERN
jgi:predicted small integral membrane protein